MKEVRDTKNQLLYQVVDGKIIAHGPKNMTDIFEPIKEAKASINKDRVS